MQNTEKKFDYQLPLLAATIVLKEVLGGENEKSISVVFKSSIWRLVIVCLFI